MKSQNILEGIQIGVMIIGIILFFVVMPVVVTWGVVTGRLDIETLEPVSVQEQIDSEAMIQGGGY